MRACEHQHVCMRMSVCGGHVGRNVRVFLIRVTQTHTHTHTHTSTQSHTGDVWNFGLDARSHARGVESDAVCAPTAQRFSFRCLPILLSFRPRLLFGTYSLASSSSHCSRASPSHPLIPETCMHSLASRSDIT